jgi:maltose alpha-D-glucosyltransferase/alpha-amylase
MQWSSDRNAGFSRANPQRLILPIIIDPEYHYEAINVELQQDNPNSLLWWTKRLVALRKQFQAFGRGTMELLTPANYRVLAFIRELRNAEGDVEETVLVVANLSRFPQYVEMDLSKWKGMRPIELVGHTQFPAIGELPYLLTLAGHGFYWFSIEPPPAAEAQEQADAYVPPILVGRSADSLLLGDEKVAIEDALPAFLRTRHWFRGRAFRIVGAHVEEAVPLGDVSLLIARIEYADHEAERYVVPLVAVTDGRPVPPRAIAAMLRLPAGEIPLADAADEAGASRAVFDAIRARVYATGASGIVETIPFVELAPIDGEPRDISAEHASAAIRYGDRYLLKLFRRLDDGVSPELELGRVLNARAPGLSPEIVGAIQYRRRRGEPTTLAVLQGYVPNEATAWYHAREELRRFFERVLSRHREEPAAENVPRKLLALAATEPPVAARERIGTYLDHAALLGRRTAEMHLALGGEVDDPSFTPEPYSALDRRSKYQSMRNLVGKTLRLLRSNLDRLPPTVMPLGRQLLDGHERLLKLFEPFLTHRITGLRIRTHGDYHLNQLLYTGNNFVLIDFDGPPGETLAERRRKHICLRDVAGMIRSFHFAAATASLDGAAVRDEDRAVAGPWADTWYRWVAGSFLRSYLEAASGAAFLPAPEDLELLLDTYVIQKAFHELRDELVRCGETTAIPLSAIAELALGD